MTSQNDFDPIREFQQWFAEAKATPLRDPNAMALATVDAENRPQVRMVLMKEFDQRGLVFFTNFTSHKAQNLSHNSSAAACFFWESTRKQVRITGRVAVVSDQEADSYFDSRPRDSQIGAWASLQSQSMGERRQFEDSFAELQELYKSKSVPRPAHWSGYRIVP